MAEQTICTKGDCGAVHAFRKIYPKKTQKWLNFRCDLPIIWKNHNVRRIRGLIHDRKDWEPSATHYGNENEQQSNCRRRKTRRDRETRWWSVFRQQRCDLADRHRDAPEVDRSADPGAAGSRPRTRRGNSTSDRCRRISDRLETHRTTHRSTRAITHIGTSRPGVAVNR